MGLAVIILAAGKGTRMKTKLPKLLHKLGDKTLLNHVVITSKELSPEQIIVVVNEEIKEKTLPDGVKFAVQLKQDGTASAVNAAFSSLDENIDKILILNGDVPLIKSETLKKFIKKTNNNLGIITSFVKNPFGLGRIIRENEKIKAICEQADLSSDKEAINEIYSGIMMISVKVFKNIMSDLSADNAQKEYYLTSIIEKYVSLGENVVSIDVPEEEILGINNQKQLMEVERIFQKNQAIKLLEEGACIKDINRLDIRGNIKIGSDVTIDVNVVIEGNVAIGNNVYIGPNNFIKDSLIGDNVTIEPNNVIDGVKIANKCKIGPFARLRPDAELKENVKIGNFVEIKKSLIDENTKINHLSYVGDASIGKNVNLGAGVITCNYDGAFKHHTKIGDDVFVGSGTQIVAPVKIGKGATIGAGALVLKDAPEGQLTFSVNQQKSISGWIRSSKD